MPTPAQLDGLLDALPLADRVPFALAAMTSARRQEILNLDWPHVDFDHDQVALADAEDYAKSRAATRVAPVVPPAASAALGGMDQPGAPGHGAVCRPRRASKRGRLSVEALYVRCDRRWQSRALTPLRLHVARHACASYLRAAGVPLKVRSAILGHASTSSLSMTEDRYTHLMPGDLDAAKQALAAYLRASAKRQRKRHAGHLFGHPQYRTPDGIGLYASIVAASKTATRGSTPRSPAPGNVANADAATPPMRRGAPPRMPRC